MRGVRGKGRRRRGSTLILVMFMLPVFLIPMVGLAIDGTMLYIVQTKLQSACDGAALGAGRLIGTHADPAEIANEFLHVNFTSGFWGTQNLVPTITATNTLGVHTVTVDARVDVPLLFMRVLGMPKSTVSAMAQATRKDTRTVIVLDRSGSMNNVVNGVNVFTTMVNSAKLFAGMLTPGLDEVGLVVYSGSGIVAYPTTRPYNRDVNSGGGPNATFATTSTSGPIFDQLSLLTAGGGTGMTEGLSLAYIELQKAHYRDLAEKGVDNNLNSIVLFTDGVPNGLAVYPNDPLNNTLLGTSGCTYNPATTNTASQMKGYMVATGPPFSTSSNTAWGLFRLQAYDTSHTLTYWLQTPGSSPPQGDMIQPDPVTAVAGCVGFNRTGGTGTGGYNNLNAAQRTIPATDIYGNSTTNSFYNKAKFYNGTSYSNLQPDQAYHVMLAAWGATDNLGDTIRSQNSMLPITIYTIGFTGNGGTDAELLRRLANTRTATSYDPNQQTGMYIQVDDPSDLANAFSLVASQLLRLAK